MEKKKLSPIGQIVRDIVMALVDFPEDVEVAELIGGQVTVFEVLVRQSDHGKVIGRGGRLIEAVRRFLNCCAGRDARIYRVDLLEDSIDPARRHELSTHPSHTEDPVQAESLLLLRMVQALVDEPEAVVVTPLAGTQSAVFEVEVARDDVRRVLGRRGATADALRELTLSMGARANRRYILQILEP